MTTAEEFSFPITASPAGAFIDSPPMWRRRVDPAQAASTSSSTSSEEEEEGREHPGLQRKSYSSIEGSRGLIEMDGPDRMDLLWEFFNEDPPRKRHSSVGRFGDTADEGEFPALDLSKAGGGRAVIARNKKLRLVVLARVFKRMFLLQHQPVIKNRSW